jgi:tetratricopeptide (TPR) repeat protein
MSQTYLSRLTSAVASAKTNDELAIHRAELAGALARFGEIDGSKALVAEIRRSNPMYLPSLSACALLAEGQILHFQSLATGAVKSFRAAEALSRSANRIDIAATALAWVAASEFLNGDVSTAAKHACTSLREASLNAFSARARGHLVIADCLSSAGLSALASKHYLVARDHASKMGDISMQSTVLYNKAAFELSELSLSRVNKTTTDESVRRVDLSIQSVESLDASIGLSSLSSLVPILRAQFAVAAEAWNRGIALYDAHLSKAVTQGQDRWMAKFLAERALCLARTGAIDEASSACDSALAQLDKCMDLDDLAISHSRLASTFAALGKQSEAAEHERASLELLKSFRDQQTRVQFELDEVLTDLSKV